MSKDGKNQSPRIANRRAMHDFFITAKVECGMALVGSEVKSLRAGHAQLQDAFAKVEGNRLVLYGCHIDPYEKAALNSHEPKRSRVLLVHRRELKKLASEASERGVTLVPLAIYFKNGRAKLELGVGQGKRQFDKRETIKRKELDREVRRAMSHRQ